MVLGKTEMSRQKELLVISSSVEATPLLVTEDPSRLGIVEVHAWVESEGLFRGIAVTVRQIREAAVKQNILQEVNKLLGKYGTVRGGKEVR